MCNKENTHKNMVIDNVVFVDLQIFIKHLLCFKLGIEQ